MYVYIYTRKVQRDFIKMKHKKVYIYIYIYSWKINSEKQYKNLIPINLWSESDII